MVCSEKHKQRIRSGVFFCMKPFARVSFGGGIVVGVEVVPCLVHCLCDYIECRTVILL